MVENPQDFDKLIFPRGGSPRAQRWRRWSEMLAKMLRASSIHVPEFGYLKIEHVGGVGMMQTTRPIPMYILAKTDASGIPIRNATTGAWGSGTVTLYETSMVSGVRRSVLGSRTNTAYNDTAVAIPASKDVKCIEQGGDLLVIAVIC